MRIGLLAFVFAGIACSAVEGRGTGASSADLVANPLASVKATKVADLGGPHADYLQMIPVDATHVLLEREDRTNSVLELVDTAAGTTRDLGTASVAWQDISVSSNKKWVVAEKGEENDILYTASVAADPARKIGWSDHHSSSWPAASFVGDTLVVAFGGALHGYDPGTGNERWKVTFSITYDYIRYSISADGARVFAFTDKMAAFVDVADGHAQPVKDWSGTLITAKFEPSGDAVLAIRGSNPDAKLVRVKSDGSPASEVDPAEAYADILVRADGKKAVYQYISGPASWFSWPTGFAIRDLQTNDTMRLGTDYLGGRWIDKDSSFLADGHTLFSSRLAFFFDTDAPGSAPVDVVPEELADHSREPNVKRTPGDTGFIIKTPKAPGTYFRRMDTGAVAKLGFEKGSLASIDVPHDGRQSAIVRTNKADDGFDADWLISLTTAQKCTKLSSYAVGWANGYAITYAAGALEAVSGDGRFSAPILEKSTKPYDRRPLAMVGKSVFVERDNALFRIDLPDYTPAATADGADSDTACDQTPPAVAADDAGPTSAPPVTVPDAGAVVTPPDTTETPSVDAGASPPPPSKTTPSAPWPVTPATEKSVGAKATPTVTSTSGQPVAQADSGCSMSPRGGSGAMLGIGMLAVLAASRRRRRE